jgi:DNA (cytosine-5)-methyltransferase 1
MMELVFGSLFTGIGGIDLGFERAGLVCKWQVEIDPFCQKVLTKHWPDVPKFGDIRDVGGHNLEAVDLIVGGFPCQPHSVAGKRRGAADDRNLWPEYLRIIQELKPTWVVGENVAGIITTYLITVLSDLEGEGYEVQTFNLPACGFDAPHRRERIFVVAYAPNTRIMRRQRPQENANRQIGGRGRDGNVQRWPPEPGMGRVAHGVPNRVDRIRGLGNAVVPQVAEFIGEALRLRCDI